MRFASLTSTLALCAAQTESNSACSGFSDCGSCVDYTVVGGHVCNWCEVDQACHVTGSTDSACYPSIENEHCVTKDSVSSCSKSSCPAPDAGLQPKHLHLSLAGPTGMRVVWKTDAQPKACKVAVSPDASSSYEGQVQYLEGHGFHHSAVLRSLAPGQTYSYQVSCDSAAADKRSFKVPATDLSSATIGVIGDMGTYAEGNAFASRKHLELIKQSSDIMVHVGDIGYADDSFWFQRKGICSAAFCYEGVYDEYMAWMENITDHLPYMVLPGNHESECHSTNCLANRAHAEALRNFSAYNARWRMPSQESGGVLSMWYSFDYGPIHFVSTNTETDFPDAPEGEYGDGGKKVGLKAGHFAPDGEYLRWLEADLQTANKNRAQRPFIVAMGHRTWIHQHNSSTEPAVAAAHKALFEKYNVDLYLAGHQHAYSRHSPLEGTAGIPVVVTGAAGCDEGLEGWAPFGPVQEDGWEHAGSGQTYQVGTLDATMNSLTWKAHNSETGEVFDSFTVKRRSALLV